MTLTNFQFYKPCKELQPYIRYYWVFKSNQPLNTLTFPIGCPQIIFHKQTPLYIPELRTVQSEFTVSGQVNYPSHPISLLHNQEVSGYDLENKHLKRLAAQIFDCENTSLCISLIEQWLLSQIADILTSKTAYNIKRITAAIKRLFAMPAISVTELASVACLSKKQFEVRIQKNTQE